METFGLCPHALRLKAAWQRHSKSPNVKRVSKRPSAAQSRSQVCAQSDVPRLSQGRSIPTKQANYAGKGWAAAGDSGSSEPQHRQWVAVAPLEKEPPEGCEALEEVPCACVLCQKKPLLGAIVPVVSGSCVRAPGGLRTGFQRLVS